MRSTSCLLFTSARTHACTHAHDFFCKAKGFPQLRITLLIWELQEKTAVTKEEQQLLPFLFLFESWKRSCSPAVLQSLRRNMKRHGRRFVDYTRKESGFEEIDFGKYFVFLKDELHYKV